MDSKDDLLLKEEIKNCKRRRISVDQFDSLLYLPNEMLIKIMRYVPLPDLSISLWPLGNKRVRLLCLEFCSRIYIKKEWDMDTARKVILMASPKLTNLTLPEREDNGDFNNSLAVQALKSSPNLIFLQCIQSSLSEAVMLAIGESNSMLGLQLGISRHSCKSQGCDCPTIEALIPGVVHLRNLTQMNLIWVPPVDDDQLVLVWLRAIIDNCKQLKFFKMPRSLKLSDEMFELFLEEFQGRLRILAVNGNKFTNVSYHMLRNCKRLKTLRITDALQLDVEGLTAIAEMSSKLRSLHLSQMKNLTGQDFVQVFSLKTMGLLSELFIQCSEGFNDNALQEIAVGCPNLELLSVSACKKVSDYGVRKILDHCKKIKYLGVKDTSVTSKLFTGCDNYNLKIVMTDEKLKKDFARNMPGCKFIE